MDRGTDARNLLYGKVIPLRLGYFGVVNRSQEVIINLTGMQTLVNDVYFFEVFKVFLKINLLFFSKTRNNNFHWFDENRLLLKAYKFHKSVLRFVWEFFPPIFDQSIQPFKSYKTKKEQWLSLILLLEFGKKILYFFYESNTKSFSML